MKFKMFLLPVLVFSPHMLFAGTMGPVCTADNVTTPCKNTAWSFGGQALYLKATYSGDFAYATEQRITPNVDSLNEREAGFGWGFKLEGAYHFNSGNDLDLNWYHYSHLTSSSFVVGDDPIISGTDSYTLKPEWNAVNLELGQHVDFNALKNLRLHGGVAYSQIKTTNSETGVPGIEEGELTTMKFSGFGPRVGADMQFGLINNLAIYANVATSIFIGQSEFVATDLSPVNFTVQGSRQTVVPSTELKAGVNYGYLLGNGEIKLDVGYMFVNYFSPLQSGEEEINTDFALNGLYFGAKWTGNIA